MTRVAVLSALVSGLLFAALGFQAGHALGHAEARAETAETTADVAHLRAEALRVSAQVGQVCQRAVWRVAVQDTTESEGE